jgi:hypothetical protein
MPKPIRVDYFATKPGISIDINWEELERLLEYLSAEGFDSEGVVEELLRGMFPDD